ncbi:MAG: hypothetical protein FWD76_06260, partial [Firmicutes bacterium]|nr:hypothetical protein [Bacillota bacterium]
MEKAKNFRRLFLSLILLVGLMASIATPTIIAPSATKALRGDGRFAGSIYVKDLEIGDYLSKTVFQGDWYNWRVIAKDEQGVMVRAEYVVSYSGNSSGNGLLPAPSPDDINQFVNMAYSESGTTEDIKDRFGKSLINPWIAHRTQPASGTTSRNKSGSNYWEQSNVRWYLANSWGYWSNNTATAVAGKIVANPLVQQPLSWVDVSRSVLNAGKTSILMNQPDPNYTDYAVWGRKSDGSWIGNADGSDSYTDADKFSGKKTFWNNDPDGVPYNLVYTNVQGGGKTSVDLIYNNGPYYQSNDRQFLAPTNILLSDEVKALRNPKGGAYTQGLDKGGTARFTWTSLPVPNKS